MGTELIPADIHELYEIVEWKHACAILKTDFPTQFNEIIDVLRTFRVVRSHILVGGGGRSYISRSLDSAFYRRGWKEKRFKTKIVVGTRVKRVPTHKVDCFRRQVALEIEWSNKDPFFDRDLSNFRLLHELRAVSVGVIITKSDELVPILKAQGKEIWDKYGRSTTWMSKLRPRIRGGGAGGCPVLVFGIRGAAYVADVSDDEAKGLADRAKVEYGRWKEEQKEQKRQLREQKQREKREQREREKREAQEQRRLRKRGQNGGKTTHESQPSEREGRQPEIS